MNEWVVDLHFSSYFHILDIYVTQLNDLSMFNNSIFLLGLTNSLKVLLLPYTAHAGRSRTRTHVDGERQQGGGNPARILRQRIYPLIFVKTRKYRMMHIDYLGGRHADIQFIAIQ